MSAEADGWALERTGQEAVRGVLAIPAEQLKDVRVLQTWIGGELVYEKR
jgi:hypothetical protein